MEAVIFNCSLSFSVRFVLSVADAVRKALYERELAKLALIIILLSFLLSWGDYHYGTGISVLMAAH